MTENMEPLQNKKLIHLMIIKDHQRIEYQGTCKLKLTNLRDAKHLFITPTNEDFKLITVSFETLSIHHKNILCVFDKEKNNNFALVFHNDNLCKKIHELISKNNPKLSLEVSKKGFYKKFLTPLCKTINKTLTPEMFFKEILKDLWNAYEGNEKDVYINFLKKKMVVDIILEFIKKEPNIEANKENESEPSLNETESNESNIQENIINASSEIEEPPSKKQKTNNEYSESRSSMLSEMNLNDSHCQIQINPPIVEIEVVHETDGNNQATNNCQNDSALTEPMNSSVLVRNNEEDQSDETLLMDLNENPETPPLQKDNLAISDGNASNLRKQSSKLISSDQTSDNHSSDDDIESETENEINGCDENVFNDNDQEEEEAKANEINLNDKILQDVYKDNFESMNDIWFMEKTKIIRPPSFVLQCNTKMEPKTILCIFAQNDRNMCYKYYKSTLGFYCWPCRKEKKSCKARIIFYQGEECILLHDFEHVCEPKQYKPEKKKIIKPDFELTSNMKGKENSLLIIFHPENKNLCYILNRVKSTNYFYCYKCKPHIKLVQAKYHPSENGEEEYFEVYENDHICPAQEYKLIKEKMNKKAKTKKCRGKSQVLQPRK